MVVNNALLPINRGQLTDPVCRVLGDPAATVTSWQIARIDYVEVGSVSGGLYRLRGMAQSGERGPERPWSLVVKVARAQAVGSVTGGGQTIAAGWGRDPSHSHYWQREALAYRSGLFNNLTDGLVAPRCYGVTERPDEAHWIWLEDIAGTDDVAWDSQRYCLAARHLGHFNGAFLVERAVPADPWVSSDWLRQYCTQRAANFDVALIRNDATWAHPLVRDAFPRGLGERIIRVWSEREMLLAGLDRLPQTFCHLDAHRRNLAARTRADGREETVAIDWAFVGRAAIGTDAGQLASSSLIAGDVSPERASQLWEQVLASYQDGLAAAGWQGDARHVRFGMAALVAVRWAFWLPMLALSIAVDERRHAAAEQLFKQPIAERVARFGPVCSCLLERAEEARTLLAALR